MSPIAPPPLPLQQLSLGTPQLTVLRLNGACKITDDALMAVGANCPILEELSIRYSSWLGPGKNEAVAIDS